MKRIIVLALLALLLGAIALMVSCSDEEEEKVPEKTPSAEENYEDMFIQTREDTELSFFSFFGREGFDSYILSFPIEWVEKEWADEISSDRKGFFEKAEEAVEKLAKDRIADYGDTFEVGYSHILDEKIEGDELEALKTELAGYGVTTDLVTEAVRAHYSIAYFSDADKTSKLHSSSLVLTLFFIKGEGWFVSPSNYIPVEF